MKTELIEYIRTVLRRPSITLALLFPNHYTFWIMRKGAGIHLNVSELSLITGVVKSRTPCNVLVFGLGNDSVYWQQLNKLGETAFIEDNTTWYERVTKRDRIQTATVVNYNTRLNQWNDLIEFPEKLTLDLDKDYFHRQWDVILVDGPAGHHQDSTGRMKSIYTARELANNTTDIFIHDIDRIVESQYCKHYFKLASYKQQVERLCHFRL